MRRIDKSMGMKIADRGGALAVLVASVLAAAVGTGCAATQDRATSALEPSGAEAGRTPIRVARLAGSAGHPAALDALRADFERRNPGYALDWRPDLRQYHAGARSVVAFVQTGSTPASVLRADGGILTCEPELTVGDVVLLRPGESLDAKRGLGAVLFEVPQPFAEGLPTFVRPDWDESITDTPGGCAEETGAYRRILLTWLPAIGPYVYRALNCHRVRITDSFAHYHPVIGGFDEFYLVQMVQPGAVLYTSEATTRILDPTSVTAEEARDLMQVHELAVGDLVYLPRGTIHRGVGGVLAQVITVPGFRPGAEIGVDHHLRAINERLKLQGDAALPYRAASSEGAVVK